MNRRFYSWVVLAAWTVPLAGCQWSDIGSPNDMASRQDQLRENRAIPTAAEMPPGLGEDLPMADTPATQPLTSNK